jgi:hypothetical protein
MKKIILDSLGSRQRSVTGFYEQGNEPSASMKGREFLNQLIYYQLLNKELIATCV